MISRLSEVLHRNQQSLQAQIVEQLSGLEQGRGRRAAVGRVVSPSWFRLLGILVTSLEEGGEEALWHWADACAQESVEAGGTLSEALDILHQIASEIRAYLATCFWRQRSLMQALDHFEERMSCLRQRYVETYEALLEVRRQRWQSGVFDMVRGDRPEAMLKRIVVTAQMLSQARYVALYVAVETSVAGVFFAKAGDVADVIMADRPPAWCAPLVAQLGGDQVAWVDGGDLLKRALARQAVGHDACLGVALRAESGVIGYLFWVFDDHLEPDYQANRSFGWLCRLQRYTRA